MNIRICNYEIMNFSHTDLLISEKGITTLTSPVLIQALEELKPFIDHDIPETKLRKILEGKRVDIDEALTFFKSRLNIIHEPKSGPYEKVIIIHDYQDDDALPLRIIRGEVAHGMTVINIRDFSELITCGKRDLVVILCEDYDYLALKSLYFNISRSAPQSGIVVAHHMPSSYYFSQPYFAEIGNPCHFCHADRILSYEGRKKSKNNWAQLLTFSKRHEVSVPCGSKPLSLLHQSMIAGFLTSRINLFSTYTNTKRHQDSALSSACINLVTGKIEEEIVPHWTLCQCLRMLA